MARFRFKWVKWRRSRGEGFVDSHDGRFAISPLYEGTTRPQCYQCRDQKTNRVWSGQIISHLKWDADNVVEAEHKTQFWMKVGTMPASYYFIRYWWRLPKLGERLQVSDAITGPIAQNPYLRQMDQSWQSVVVDDIQYPHGKDLPLYFVSLF